MPSVPCLAGFFRKYHHNSLSYLSISEKKILQTYSVPGTVIDTGKNDDEQEASVLLETGDSVGTDITV